METMLLVLCMMASWGFAEGGVEPRTSRGVPDIQTRKAVHTSKHVAYHLDFLVFGVESTLARPFVTH